MAAWALQTSTTRLQRLLCSRVCEERFRSAEWLLTPFNRLFLGFVAIPASCRMWS